MCGNGSRKWRRPYYRNVSLGWARTKNTLKILGREEKNQCLMKTERYIALSVLPAPLRSPPNSPYLLSLPTFITVSVRLFLFHISSLIVSFPSQSSLSLSAAPSPFLSCSLAVPSRSHGCRLRCPFLGPSLFISCSFLFKCDSIYSPQMPEYCACVNKWSSPGVVEKVSGVSLRHIYLHMDICVSCDVAMRVPWRMTRDAYQMHEAMVENNDHAIALSLFRWLSPNVNILWYTARSIE